MEALTQSLPEFVVCINNVDYPASLGLHKIYRIVPDEDATTEGDIRVIHPSPSNGSRVVTPSVLI